MASGSWATLSFGASVGGDFKWSGNTLAIYKSIVLVNLSGGLSAEIFHGSLYVDGARICVTRGKNPEHCFMFAHSYSLGEAAWAAGIGCYGYKTSDSNPDDFDENEWIGTPIHVVKSFRRWMAKFTDPHGKAGPSRAHLRRHIAEWIERCSE